MMLDRNFILAAAEAGTPTVSETIEIVVVGFSFVLVILSVLAAATAVIGACFARGAARSARDAQRAAEQAAERKDFPSGTAGSVAPGAEKGAGFSDDPALLAVVAAAIHSVYGDRPHRLVSIRSAGPGWAQEGRRQIFSSHRVR